MNEAGGRRLMPVAIRVLLWILIVIVVLGAAAYVAFQVSPRPAVLIISRLFKSGGSKVSRALEKHVPDSDPRGASGGLTAQLRYGAKFLRRESFKRIFLI
ncbi:MAG: hypothetical protein AB1598_00540 [Thermodesulfobacteriota bacterium]